MAGRGQGPRRRGNDDLLLLLLATRRLRRGRPRGSTLHPRSMADVHGIQVQGGTFPAEIWHAYSVRILAHTWPGAFRRGGWRLEPYHGPRSMRRRPHSRSGRG
jgi:hypothetical protein